MFITKSMAKPIAQHQFVYDSASSSLMDESYGSMQQNTLSFIQFSREPNTTSITTNVDFSCECSIPPRNSNPIPLDSSFNFQNNQMFEGSSYDSSAGSFLNEMHMHCGDDDFLF
ncbi:Uncharacterized protein QTN25_000884 [Entamoeba marina]